MFFQPTILHKYLTAIADEQLSAAWLQYKAYFLNQQIQQNIRTSNEEQFQEGFLRELFVNVLGYTLNPTPDYNLITEQKNETDSKKADGAILLDGKVIGIIELKDHKTTDLKQVEQQAFGYKHQHPNARYIIISNFEKLRFYIDNAVEYIEWNLFSLNEEQFRTLYFCLSWNTLSTFEPLKAKQESVSSEDQITKQLYKDYSAFKRELFANIEENNQAMLVDSDSRLLLFKKTQKLLDRLLFIFFAEDSGLLPPNSMIQIIDQWQQLRELDEYVPLYNRIKKYFGYMNTGYKGKHYEIFAYNGGLFKPDEVLDSLIISDDLLATHCRRLSEYDYASEVDVNILGHIFENSLNEIEEFYNNPDGATQTSKRKRDGVFYTPQYITKYIVENTVGKLCEEKKAELGINGSASILARDKNTPSKDAYGPNSRAKKAAMEKLEQYRSWLLGLTICDPACGSGAFLNAALQFLIAEHRLIDEMEAKITGSSIVFQNIENSILENNLYGVDINEESVEIAKLALWLRTAKPHRKLSSLNNNIKCGNSLISDPTIADTKAFNWQTEFPQVFAKGGFDVVIGNPPYVRAELLSQADLEYYKQHYKAFTPDGDLFSYFYEQGLNLLKEGGIFGFISNTFDKTTAGKSLRQFIQDNAKIERYVDFTDVQVFEGATTYPIILLLSKNKKNDTFPYIKIPHDMQGDVNIGLAPEKQVELSSLNADSWSFQSTQIAAVLRKINTFKTIKEQFGKCYYGIKTALNDAFFIDENTKCRLINEDANSSALIKSVFEGKDLHKWYNAPLQKYLICTHNGYADVPAIEIEGYPAIKTHLQQFEPQLSRRYDKGNTPFNLRNCAYQPLFYQPKIIWGNLQNSNKFSYDTKGTVISAPACMLPTDNKALLAILNSRIVWMFLTSICVVRNGGYIEVKPQYFEQIPVPPLDVELAEQLSSLADKMLALNKELQDKRARFLRRLKDNLRSASVPTRESTTTSPTASGDTCAPVNTPVRITTALETFDTLDFAEFVAELKKQKIRLSLVEQDEWEEYFGQYKAACNAIAAEIATTDREIDRRVYDLYGLTEEERAIVDAPN